MLPAYGAYADLGIGGTIPSPGLCRVARPVVSDVRRSEVPLLGIGLSTLQALEESQELVTGAVATELALRWSNLGERLLFHRQVGIEIDLCRLD